MKDKTKNKDLGCACYLISTFKNCFRFSKYNLIGLGWYKGQKKCGIKGEVEQGGSRQ